MADDKDDNFGKELAEAFAADEAAADPKKPETPEEKKPEDPAAPEAAPAKEESKKDEEGKPEDPKKPEEGTTPAGDEKKPEDGNPAAQDPKAPSGPEEPKTPEPLTKNDLAEAVSKIRDDERISSKSRETATQEVLSAYYPEGLSNVLVDEASGKELRTPQDVVDASGGEMTTEEAAQWLMNEQYKLDQSVNQIKADATRIADTTVSFKRDSIAAVEKYGPLFEAYPTLQRKTFDKLMKQVKVDEQKGVVLVAPDVMEFYDDMLEPYRLAFEFGQKQAATNPPAPTKEDPKVPATPGAEDRLDEGGDGGTSPVDDPEDFAQQVSKELAKGA